MKRKPDYKDGTAHHAARGHVALWATVMNQARPEQQGEIYETAREWLLGIDLDEKRKDSSQPYEL